MADIDIDELRKLLAAATPGPWVLNNIVVSAYICRSTDGHAFESILGLTNAELIVAVVNALPELLDRLERYERALRDAKRELGSIQQSPEMMGHNDIAHLCDAIEIIDKSLEQTDG